MAGVWDPLRLSFRDEEMEALYDAWSECRSVVEPVIYVMGMVACSAILVAKGVQGSFRELIVVMGANLAWLLAGGCMAVMHAEQYRNWRPILVAAVQCTGFFVVLTATRIPSQVHSVSDALIALIVKSPVSFALFALIFLPLRYRDVVKTHIFFAFSVVYFSTSEFCSFTNGESNGSGVSAFSEVGEKIDRMFEMTLFKSISLDDGHRCSCEAVATFFFLIAGSLIPMVFSYCKETISRWIFLRQSMPVELHEGILRSARMGLEFAIWSVILGMQITWIVFRKL